MAVNESFKECFVVKELAGGKTFHYSDWRENINKKNISGYFTLIWKFIDSAMN